MAYYETGGFMTIKVAIVGSCVTRDIFGFVPTPSLEISDYVARTSFISMTTPPVALDPDRLSNATGFELRSIVADFSKTTLGIWEKDFDYIIFDFIEDRFDIVRIGESYVLGNVMMLNSGALDQHPGHQRLPRLSSEVQDLWSQACRRICANIRRKIPSDKIILHKAWHASHYLDDGVAKEFTGYHAELSTRHNPMLQSQYELFESELGGIKTITARPELIVADGAHMWGRQPFHLVPEYNTDLLRSLSSLIGA
jgi:hypothetical protein